jgi:methanol metabolism-related c-type cytochrome
MMTKDAIEIAKQFGAAPRTKDRVAIRARAGSSGPPQRSPLTQRWWVGAVAVGVLAFGLSIAWADGSGDPVPTKNDNGKYYDKAGNPTFNIASDGTVDWYTYSGYRRFNSECEVCHGFDGTGSTFAPSLLESLKTMSYSNFVSVVVGGRKEVNTANDKVMPAFGTDRNVMCYLDDIYVYLRARSDSKLAGGRPEKHVDKPAAAAKAETACMGF